VLNLRPAKTIQGKVELPVSPDLLFMAALGACAAARKIKIANVNESEVLQEIERALSGHAKFEKRDSLLYISPNRDNDPALLLPLPDSLLPYRMIYLFMGLGMGKTVTMRSAPQKQLDYYIAQAKRTGIKVETETLTNELTGLKAVEWKNESLKKANIDEGYCTALLSFIFGKRETAAFGIDFHLSTPLRQLSNAFGFVLSAKSLNAEKSGDPIAQRLRFLQNKKRSGQTQSQLYTVEADFWHSNKDDKDDDGLEIKIPGDEILAAALLSAKCLVPKGDLILSNVCLESWGSQAVSFIKKMGSKLNINESGKSTFGVYGTVEIQRVENSGKKIRCTPLYQFLGQLPSMMIAAAFAKEREKSVFRDLGGLRLYEPDGIDQLEKALRPLGVRHGEMPDGIVVEGARDFDGFELTGTLDAHIAAAFCMAGLRCLGKTSVQNDSIAARWPDFEKLLDEICEFL
jgi:5-enolpyruvylshikimate-3-phosphate synthase